MKPVMGKPGLKTRDSHSSTLSSITDWHNRTYLTPCSKYTNKKKRRKEKNDKMENL